MFGDVFAVRCQPGLRHHLRLRPVLVMVRCRRVAAASNMHTGLLGVQPVGFRVWVQLIRGLAESSSFSEIVPFWA